MSEQEQFDAVSRATQHLTAGRLDAAKAIGKALLADAASMPAGLHLLAHVEARRGDDSAAINFLEQAIRHPQADGAVWTDLGFLYARLGRRDDALRTLSRAVELAPMLPEAWIHLADARLQTGDVGAAAEAYCRAISLAPDEHAFYARLGGSCDRAETIDTLFGACAGLFRSDSFGELATNATAWFNLAFAAQLRGSVDAAIKAYRQTLELVPAHPHAGNNLGTALRDSGQIAAALECFRAAASAGSVISRSNLLYLMHFQPDVHPHEVRAEHERWNAQHAAALLPRQPAPPPTSAPDRRLRIGYVSPDFCEHPVGRFLTQLFAHHDHGQMEIFAYSSVEKADGITTRLRACADHWIDALELSDESLAQRIRADEIHVLVDLTMHMRGSRLLCFARKPAPIQVTYLAYCSTTGVRAIDYRLTDPFLDPIESAQVNPSGDTGRDGWYVERSVRLPKTYWCYEPGIATPEVSSLPALSRGYVTFASFNNFSKVSPAALAAWARILAATKNSRLLLHTHRGMHRNDILETLASQGVAAERIVFVDSVPLTDYFKLHQFVDIALDTFPYAGGTTTCDALWMGVPVVSLVGRSAVSRGGLSILTNAGFPELARDSIEDYVAECIALAADIPRLGSLRSALRPAMQRSPLMDGRAFARDIEACFRNLVAQ